MRKNIRIVIILVLLISLGCLCCLVMQSDIYQRHFGYGFSDRIRVFLYCDGEPVPTSEYSVSMLQPSGDICQKKYGYSTAGSYGEYCFHVTYGKRQADCIYYNYNNWYRTDILLYASSSDNTVQKIIYVFNNDPPIMSNESIEWESFD